jgi:DNA-binding response OmpR family regulator
MMKKAEMNKILLVNTVDSSRKVLISLLEESGFHVLVSDVPGEAIKIFQESPFDLVILNLNVPNSLDVLKEINNTSPNTPVIIISEKITIINVIQTTVI